MNRALTIGTRASPLALWQAHFIRQKLLLHHPDLVLFIKTITTTGDQILDRPLQALGGKGLFIKEIESALASHEIDLAVHSLKDLPHTLDPRFELACIPAREDPADILITRAGLTLAGLPKNAIIGTSSIRRAVQLKQQRPDLCINPLRGNVGTRLLRLDEGKFSAIILAYAGLKRLEIDRAGEKLNFIPAVGQGALGVEIRHGDDALKLLLAPIHDSSSAFCVALERKFLQMIQGDCQTPSGCWVREVDEDLMISAFLSDPDGKNFIRIEQQTTQEEADQAIRTIAKKIIPGPPLEKLIPPTPLKKGGRKSP